MPTADFAHALQIGLGRAFLLVKRNYNTSYREPLLNACFHNLAFDQQSEGSRAPYLFEIINATNEVDFYREAILTRLSQLPAADDGNDSYQMYELVACFARERDLEAREVLLNKFRAFPGFGDFALAKIIIDLDGAEGFRWVLAELGAHLLTQGEEFVVGEDTYEIDDYLVFWLEKKIGETEAAKLIEQLRRENNPPVIAILDYLEQHSRSAHRQYEPAPQLSYSEIKQRIYTQPDRVGVVYSRWGRYASAAELRLAAEDLITETDLKRLHGYLAIFRNTPFPLNHTFLFDLAKHSNKFVAVSAINALENVIHPDVHEFALNNIEHGWMVGRMVTLLKGAYHQDSDWLIIETLTRRVDDKEDYHCLGFSIFDVFDSYQTTMAIPSLLNLYEYNPCAACRERAARRLLMMNAVPAWMQEECLYDANMDLREWAKKNFLP